MARALLVAVMAIALVASSEACVGCIVSCRRGRGPAAPRAAGRRTGPARARAAG